MEDTIIDLIHIPLIALTDHSLMYFGFLISNSPKLISHSESQISMCHIASSATNYPSFVLLSLSTLLFPYVLAL